MRKKEQQKRLKMKCFKCEKKMYVKLRDKYVCKAIIKI